MGHYSCNNCGRIHYGISLEYAQEQVRAFNVYFDALTQYKQQEYYRGKKAALTDYTSCDTCGGDYENFMPTPEAELEIIRGSTIGPIVVLTL